MFHKIPCIFTIVFLASLLSPCAFGYPAPREQTHDLIVRETLTTPVSDNDYSAPCTTKACATEITFEDTVRIIIESATTPMGLGGPTPGNIRWAFLVTRPAVIKKRLHTVLLNHPEQFGLICAKLKDIASNYNERTEFDHSYDLNDIMQIGVLIDGKKNIGCLRGAISVLPHTPYVDELIGSAAGFCMNSQWHSPACRRIAR